MRNMGGLRQYMPVTFVLMWIATLAIAGIPPFSGFFSKDEILGAAFARGARHAASTTCSYGDGLSSAALLTAFYMARMMRHDVHGPEPHRGSGAGAPARGALDHDRPAGRAGRVEPARRWLNLPHLVGGHAALEHWLEPVVEPGMRSAATSSAGRDRPSISWSVPPSPSAALGLAAGVPRSRSAARSCRRRQAPPDTGFALVLNRKYYVDELYDALIVRPLVWLSRVVLWRGVDQGVVDGAGVNGAACVSRLAGWLGSAAADGQVGATRASSSSARSAVLRAVTPVTADDTPSSTRSATTAGSCTLLLALPLHRRRPRALLGDERSAKWTALVVTTLEFILSLGLWWALDPAWGRCSSRPPMPVDPVLGHQLPGRASTASRS